MGNVTGMLRVSLCFALLCLTGVYVPQSLAEQAQGEAPGEPELLSIFPIGAQPGTTIRAEVRGRSLAGAYDVWFGAAGLRARVEEVERIELEPPEEYDPKAPQSREGHRVWLQLTVDPSVASGMCEFRVVSPRGISNALKFAVTTYPTLIETPADHETPANAQSLAVPVAVNGRIGQAGELDYYVFEAPPDQELTFEVIANSAPGTFAGPPGRFDPNLTLYAPTGSWFEPQRPTRLAFNDEPTSSNITNAPRLTHRFNQAGRYLAQVGSFMGMGSPDYTYQLRIAPSQQWESLDREGGRAWSGDDSGWQERTFRRPLEANRVEQLWARSVPKRSAEAVVSASASAGAANAVPRWPPNPVDFSSNPRLPDLLAAGEPNDTLAQALQVSLPCLLEGAIEHPGDVDSFRFEVEAGQRLAFEVETPEVAPPHFNPRLGVFRADGSELLTNIYKRIGRNFTFYLKTVEPKTIYTFELAGEYYLQIRDVTWRYGDPGFRYRILIRPQVPHAGEIKVEEEHINLSQGEAKKLTVTTEQEEGFAGEIALTIEGLPPGVKAVTGTEVQPERGPPLDEGEKERFVSKNQTAVILLVASPQAPLTRSPHRIRVVARPVVEGKMGRPLKAQQLPLMIVAPPEMSSGNRSTERVKAG